MSQVNAPTQRPEDLNASQALITWAESAAASMPVYALVDMAAVPPGQDATRLLRQFGSAGAVSVLGDRRPQAEAATPWLLPLTDRQGLHHHLLQTTLHLAQRGPCVTWLASQLALPELARRLRERTDAMLPQAQPVLLRCYDPRVLPELHKVLHPEQAASYWALGGGSWSYFSRTHQLESLALGQATEVDPFEAPLNLDDAQFATLLDAAEVDSVMPELAREAPDAFQALPAGQRAAFTRRCLALADAWHLESFAQRVIVGVLALNLGEDFHQQPAWAPWIAQLKQRKIGLVQAIEKATGK